eukprot:TRINITY_DN2447_c0_g1_i5.p1 TRINITY_DN2447_c0_g1~~TRINITY_DN2447_c0_g1_i5.p1  ORF type:complete len:1110 (-),score=204.17 TRINITY_DN2447_c0_g1_i5:902-4231(-)
MSSSDSIWEKGELVAATFTKLISEITSAPTGFGVDASMIKDFMYTLESFAEPVDVLNELIKIFKENSSIYTQLRVINFIRDWTDKCWYTFSRGKNGLINILNVFLDELVGTCTTKELIDRVNALKEQIQTSQKDDEMSLYEYVISPNILALKNIHELEVGQIANQIIYLDHQIFRLIKPGELLDQKFTKNDTELTPNVCRAIRWFNSLSQWAVCEVLCNQNPKIQVKVLLKVIEIAHVLYLQRDFSGFVAVSTGLTSGALARLKMLWSQIPSRVKTNFEKLASIADPKHNFKRLRKALEKTEKFENSEPPCVPYLGMFLQDLVFIDESARSEKEKYDGLIYFRKCSQVASLIKQLLRYQSVKYNIEPDFSIQEYLTYAPRFGTEYQFTMADFLEPNSKISHHKSYVPVEKPRQLLSLEERNSKFKILLLGRQDSGKSTIFKYLGMTESFPPPKNVLARKTESIREAALVVIQQFFQLLDQHSEFLNCPPPERISKRFTTKFENTSSVSTTSEESSENQAPSEDSEELNFSSRMSVANIPSSSSSSMISTLRSSSLLFGRQVLPFSSDPSKGEGEAEGEDLDEEDEENLKFLFYHSFRPNDPPDLEQTKDDVIKQFIKDVSGKKRNFLRKYRRLVSILDAEFQKELSVMLDLAQNRIKEIECDYEKTHHPVPRAGNSTPVLNHKFLPKTVIKTMNSTNKTKSLPSPSPPKPNTSHQSSMSLPPTPVTKALKQSNSTQPPNPILESNANGFSDSRSGSDSLPSPFGSSSSLTSIDDKDAPVQAHMQSKSSDNLISKIGGNPSTPLSTSGGGGGGASPSTVRAGSRFSSGPLLTKSRTGDERTLLSGSIGGGNSSPLIQPRANSNAISPVRRPVLSRNNSDGGRANSVNMGDFMMSHNLSTQDNISSSSPNPTVNGLDESSGDVSPSPTANAKFKHGVSRQIPPPSTPSSQIKLKLNQREQMSHLDLATVRSTNSLFTTTLDLFDADTAASTSESSPVRVRKQASLRSFPEKRAESSPNKPVNNEKISTSRKKNSKKSVKTLPRQATKKSILAHLDPISSARTPSVMLSSEDLNKYKKYVLDAEVIDEEFSSVYLSSLNSINHLSLSTLSWS